jgi:hypothetical protein
MPVLFYIGHLIGAFSVLAAAYMAYAAIFYVKTTSVSAIPQHTGFAIQRADGRQKKSGGTLAACGELVFSCLFS